jgi:hypothetical protein
VPARIRCEIAPDLGVQHLIVEQIGGIRVHEDGRMTRLDDLVAGLERLSQREPKGGATVGVRRRPGRCAGLIGSGADRQPARVLQDLELGGSANRSAVASSAPIRHPPPRAD